MKKTINITVTVETDLTNMQIMHALADAVGEAHDARGHDYVDRHPVYGEWEPERQEHKRTEIEAKRELYEDLRNAVLNNQNISFKDE